MSGKPHQDFEVLTAPTARNVQGIELGNLNVPVWLTVALILYLSGMRAGMVQPQL